jgi:hypothetical protein
MEPDPEPEPAEPAPAPQEEEAAEEEVESAPAAGGDDHSDSAAAATPAESGDGIRMEGPPGESGPERRARIARQMEQKRAKKEAAAEAERERQQLIDHFLIISAKVAGMGGSVAAGDTCCCVAPAPVQEEFEAESKTVAELAVGEEVVVLEVKAIDGDSRQLRVRSDRGWTSCRSATEILLEKKIVQGNDLRFDLHLGYPRGTPQPGAVEHFCYPVDVTTVGAPPGQYTFMMTLDGGDRQFGFCRTLIQPDGYQTLIIMTRYPWFSVFTPLLEALEVYSGRGQDVMERILDSAVESCRDSFPRPGQPFRAILERATGETPEKGLALSRPKDDSTPLADADPDFYMLFQALSVPAVMAVFRALLSECRIIMISEDLVRLSTCMYSICSLVFPFAWQNIFVPIIPEMFLDYCTAPMPFIVGVHTSLMPQVERIPGIEDEVVMVNLDTNEVSLDMDTLKELPADEEAKLTAQVTRLFTELTAVRGRFSRKKPMSAATFNASIEEAFIQFMLSIFGQYRRFLDPTNDWEFDVEAYTDPSTKHGVFLEAFRESQMFEAWCSERSELARKKFPSANKFESQVSTIVRKGGESKRGGSGQAAASPTKASKAGQPAEGGLAAATATTAAAAAAAPKQPASAAGGGGGATEAAEEEEYAVGYGSKATVVRVEDKRIKGGWATLWLELDGDTIRWFDVEEDGSKPVGQPLAVIPCEYTKTSNPKSAREDAPHAFRIDVETTQTAGGAGMHQGWMTKKGGLREGGKKRRWCQMQLQGLELAYYDQQPAEGGQLKGEINLADCESVSRAEEEGGQHTIELIERADVAAAGDGGGGGGGSSGGSGKQRSHVFVCEDEESCGMWLEALEGALSDISNGVEEQPLTPGVERRIRTGTQFRKKCTYTRKRAAFPPCALLALMLRCLCACCMRASLCG